MTHTSEHRTYLLKAPGASIIRERIGLTPNLPCLPAVAAPFLPGHSDSIPCEERTPFCIGALVYAAHDADISAEKGKLNKVRSGRRPRAKAHSGISSGMIYLTRFVLIRAYYMRDREPRRSVGGRLTIREHVSLTVARLDPSRRVVSSLSRSPSFLAFHPAPRYIYHVSSIIKFQKRNRERERETMKTKDISYIIFGLFHNLHALIKFHIHGDL